jgi:2-polyprenyl-3-methyl-5-hydroxy-6-metoxy-1,4-benzoquinol methylase
MTIILNRTTFNLRTFPGCFKKEGNMEEHKHYVIRGGVAGRERLRILSRVLAPTTTSLFDRVGIKQGLACLDVGCGGGDVTLMLAQRVGPTGRVIGLDMDDIKLTMARDEAEAQQLDNVRFECSDINDWHGDSSFDLIYSRCLLTHLQDPARVLVKMGQALRPGGVVIIEDIDFSGHMCHPDLPAFQRYMDLYTEIVQRRGEDPNIGPRLLDYSLTLVSSRFR